MADKAIAKGFVASAVSSGVIEEPSMPGHVNAIGNGRVAQTRDALELSKLSLELNQLEADVLSPDELRTKKQHERKKSLLELNKLHRDDAYEQQKTKSSCSGSSAKPSSPVKGMSTSWRSSVATPQTSRKKAISK
jgi:hypothetical protein